MEALESPPPPLPCKGRAIVLRSATGWRREGWRREGVFGTRGGWRGLTQTGYRWGWGGAARRCCGPQQAESVWREGILPPCPSPADSKSSSTFIKRLSQLHLRSPSGASSLQERRLLLVSFPSPLGSTSPGEVFPPGAPQHHRVQINKAGQRAGSGFRVALSWRPWRWPS